MGKETIQLFAHAFIQDARKSCEKESALWVETPEIINVIIIDTNKLNIIGSKRLVKPKNTFTNLCASGTTVSKIGNAQSQLFPHAIIQDLKKL